jgi:hypothetical protein
MPTLLLRTRSGTTSATSAPSSGGNRLREATGERAIRAGEGADGCNRAVSKELVAVSCAAQERLGIPWKCGKRQAGRWISGANAVKVATRTW